MTSRELVKKTVEFDSPERIPRDLWLLPWASITYPEKVQRLHIDFTNDLSGCKPFYKQVNSAFIDAYKTTGAAYIPGIYVDSWGCIFENRQSGIIGEVKEPALKDWQEVDMFKIPIEFLSVDFDQVNAFCKSTDKFILGPASEDLPRPFERLQFIRKTENLFMDLVDQPGEFFILLDRMHQFYIKVFEIWAKTDVDGLWFMDDWGAQNSLLISPEQWRKIFKPLYKDYIDIAHQHGKYAFMHSDGYIMDILPDLIELGLDAINSQIFCMGVEELGKKFKGKITFWGEIDRQHLLPYGSAADIVNAVHRTYENLYQGGGVIGQCEFGIGAKPDNVYLVFETWSKFGN